MSNDKTHDITLAWTIKENVSSLQAVPMRLLPEGGARQILIAMAEVGLDVYAYQPAQHPDTPEEERRYNLWVLDERIEVPEWVRKYNETFHVR